AETLATMQAAVLTGEALWIGYVNADGAASQRVIAPVRVEGGFVTAYDHTADEVRTYPLHRITGVAELADEERRAPRRTSAGEQAHALRAGVIRPARDRAGPRSGKLDDWPSSARAEPVARKAAAREWSAHRPVRQDPSPRGRPRAGRRLPARHRPLRRTRTRARAHPHLPGDPARPVERAGGRPRRRAGRRRAGAVQPLPGAPRAARRHRRDDGPLRAAQPRQAPGARPRPDQHRPARAGGGAALEAHRAPGRRPHR